MTRGLGTEVLSAILAFTFVPATPLAPGGSSSSHFPPELPTPCDQYPDADRRPGHKRDGRDVYFQWIAGQAQKKPGNWCLYYAVKNLHDRENLAFRWPTSTLEKALLEPQGFVDIMTSPTRPGIPRDRDPIFYGAVAPGPSAGATAFYAPVSTEFYPRGIRVMIGGRRLGRASGPSAPALNLSELEFFSEFQQKGDWATYTLGYKVAATNTSAYIAWYPTEEEEFLVAVRKFHRDARPGGFVPLDKNAISAELTRRGVPKPNFKTAMIQLRGQVVLVIMVPVFLP